MDIKLLEENSDSAKTVSETEDEKSNDNLLTSGNKKRKFTVGKVILIIVVCVFVGMIGFNAVECLESNCYNIKVFGSEYCKNHICDYEGCKNGKDVTYGQNSSQRNYLYCYSHHCSFNYSEDWHEYCFNFADGGGKYCDEHTCIKKNCIEVVYVKDDGYECEACEKHLCRYRKKITSTEIECFNYADGGGVYCSEHTCSKKNCTYSVHPDSEYCLVCILDGMR